MNQRHEGVKKMVPPLVAIVAALALAVVAAVPAEAHHGTWHRNQHSRDAGSCCVEVQAHSQCSDNCDVIQAGIRKSGTWYTSACSGNDSCYEVFSVWRTFSYPVTVRTLYEFEADPWHWDAEYGDVAYN